MRRSEELKRALLCCDSDAHRGEITEHRMLSKYLYECAGCGHQRKALEGLRTDDRVLSRMQG